MLRERRRSSGACLGAGLAGSVVLTAANEVAHRLATEAPRLDVLGMRALVRALRATGHAPPEGRVVPGAALAGDLALNGLFYALAVGRRGRWRGAVLRGLGAGVAMGALAAGLAPRFGLDDRQGYHAGRRLAMVALYALGGLAAGVALAGTRGRRLR